MKYKNPFPGKPKPLPLSGLFLLNTEFEFKFLGLSLSGLFAENEQQSLFKGIRRISSGQTLPSTKMRQQLLGLIPGTHPLYSDFEAALLHDDADALARNDERGEWEFLAKTFQGLGSSYSMEFMVEVEHHCKQPMKLMRDGQFGSGASVLQNDSLMQRFLWPELLPLWSGIRSFPELIAIRSSVMMEVRLSCMAAMDASSKEKRLIGNGSSIVLNHLLISPENGAGQVVP